MSSFYSWPGLLFISMRWNQFQLSHVIRKRFVECGQVGDPDLLLVLELARLGMGHINPRIGYEALLTPFIGRWWSDDDFWVTKNNWRWPRKGLRAKLGDITRLVVALRSGRSALKWEANVVLFAVLHDVPYEHLIHITTPCSTHTCWSIWLANFHFVTCQNRREHFWTSMMNHVDIYSHWRFSFKHCISCYCLLMTHLPWISRGIWKYYLRVNEIVITDKRRNCFPWPNVWKHIFKLELVGVNFATSCDSHKQLHNIKAKMWLNVI